MERSAPASEELPRLIFGKPGLAHVRADVGQFSVLRHSGQGKRTSTAARTRQCEDWAQHQNGVPSNYGGQRSGQQKTPNASPRCKSMKRHLIKPATALNNPEDARERDAGKKAEQSKEEGKRDVGGAKTDYEQED